MKVFLFISLFSISQFVLSEVINLTCFNQGQVHHGKNDWEVGKNRIVKFSLGENSKLAKMSAKGYPLIEFDLKVSDTHFLIGQYKSQLKKELIPLFMINKETLMLEKDSFFSKDYSLRDSRECLIE